MAKDRLSLLGRLKDSYEYYYEITDGDADSGLPLMFYGEFHARDQGYVLIKSAKIWAAESNEYAYVFSTPHLNGETAAKCLAYAVEDGFPRVAPHKEHRDSYIIAVFLADVIDSDAEKLIRGCKHEKTYKFGFEGWSSLKAAAVDLERELITTNKAGANLQTFFKKLLRSEKA